MKKFLSICLALILVAAFSLSVFAVGTPSRKSVKKEINATVSYVSGEISGYTADSAVDYYYLVKASEKAKTFYDGFLASIKENLDANNGKIITAYGENITSYAAVIGIIGTMGGDPTDINSVNLVELFEQIESKEISTPYYYNIIIPVAAKYCDEAFVKSLCDSFIENYYIMGRGMNYWGFACDNTAMFISAISQSGLECYDDILTDAVNVLSGYKGEGGYFYNPEYGTAPNVNSTSLTLMAKCAYYTYKGTVNENLSELTDLYNALLTFKGETNGSFAYDGAESTYSAADALKGLSAYYSILPEGTPDSPDVTPDELDVKPDTKPSTDNDGETNKNPDIPNTDGGSSVFSVAVISLGVIASTALAMKKKEQAD